MSDKRIDSLVEDLHGLDGLEIKLNEDLGQYSTMRLAAKGHVILVKNEESLMRILKIFEEKGQKYRLLGLGSNQILPEDSTLFYIKLNLPFNKTLLNQVHSEYFLPASVPLGLLTVHALKFGLKGWEVFTGIPASVGGAVFMNAGTELGEIGGLVKEVILISRSGERRRIAVDRVEKYFSYRKNHFCQEGDVIVGVTLANLGIDGNVPSIIKEYLEKRSRTQPLDKLTCGCVFKNYSKEYRAGKFLDILNLKGLEFGGVRVSPVHANFIENFNNGTAADFLELVDRINKEVELQFGVKFELEVKT